MAEFWSPKCMWPSEIGGPCEHDGEIQLCSLTADYLVDGYSYCETHTKEFVQSNIEATEARINASEEISDFGFGQMNPQDLQDKTDDFLNGEWSYNGGGDE